ncbi:MAG: hypothetical protein ACRDLS_07805 [Solirubrobacteraceae bacterium]
MGSPLPDRRALWSLDANAFLVDFAGGIASANDDGTAADGETVAGR